ncbi:MAG: hypothetical protein QMB11_07265 [Nonlabens sp.]|uniref:hypothetical protein n=1 Tax=Nonlabens sp. TaxID=1888209 RepID=UPI0035A6EA8D
MISKFCSAVIAFLITAIALSQSRDNIVIRGVLNTHLCSDTWVFKSFSGNLKPIEGTLSKDNSFRLSLPAATAPGVYRIKYNEDCVNQFVDIIINGKDEEISFVLNSSKDFAVFEGSEENKLWSKYQIESQSQAAKLEILYQFLSFYPAAQDKVVQEVVEAVSLEGKVYYDNFHHFQKKNKGSWAEKMVTNQPYYFSNPTAVPTRRDFVRHDYCWDGINTHDPKLINTPLYKTLIDDYFEFNATDGDTAAEREDRFNINAAVMMEKFSHNLTTKSFATDYLKEKRSQIKRD